MEKKHLEMIQEQKDNFQFQTRETQVKRCAQVSFCKLHHSCFLKSECLLSVVGSAEGQISLPEQVKNSAKNLERLPGEDGEEELWVGEESGGQSFSGHMILFLFVS